MRCGGPRICKACAKDNADKQAAENTPLKKWITNVTKYVEDHK
jgi:hypothetical protein